MYDKYLFHVKDNGISIEEEVKSKVYEPFKRAGNHKLEGEEMGLAYVKTILRNHYGMI